MNNRTAVDAFCGAGGLTVGLERAGFDVLLGFDIDELCIKTLNYNEHKAVCCDVRDMLGGKLLEHINLNKGELDLLAGGPPCQGFSIQRTIGNDHDDRNLLVNDYGDLIEEVLPRFFLLENVAGIGGKRGREIVDKFRQRVEQVGYHCHQKILDAQDYGVPQRRRRYLIIGEYLDGCDPCFAWPEILGTKPPTVRDVIGFLPPPPPGIEHPDFPGHRADKLSQKNLERIRAIKSGQSRVDLPDHLLADCHKLSPDKIGHRNVYGRMAWDEVAPTITARFDSFTRGKFGHPEQDRSVSLYEGALLQTFPDDYKFIGNKVDVARQIGNAVPPQLAFRLGEAIYKSITATARKPNKIS